MMARTSSWKGLAGMPSIPPWGSGASGASGMPLSHAPPPSGATTASESPSSSTTLRTCPPRVAKLSAPASTTIPSSSAERMLPPSCDRASSSVTRMPTFAHSRAATSPPMPPPMTTTCCAAARAASSADCSAVMRRFFHRVEFRARGSELAVGELHDAGELVGIGLRRHAVAEIEDVPLRRAAAFDDVAHVRFEHGPRRLQQRRVDVALHGHVVSDDADRLVERHPPVHADCVDDATQAHVAQGGSGSDY